MVFFSSESPNHARWRMTRSDREILDFLRASGAIRLRKVRLKANRSTIWSLTQNGRVLNIHAAFAAAPARVLRDFVVVVREAFDPSAAYRRASRRLAAWPPLTRELHRLRREDARHREPPRREAGVGPCCATPAQRSYLRRMYLYLNRTRFGNCLPRTIPLRLSNRMHTRLGHMMADDTGGRRLVIEIALNVDLMLESNGRLRLDTLLHEMAHAADFLAHGRYDHGESWQRIAGRVGCTVEVSTRERLRRRPRGHRTVTRVPPLPLGARLSVAPGRSAVRA